MSVISSRPPIVALLLTLALASSAPTDDAQPAPEQWPQWRGPLGTGEAPRADPPILWSEERNVAWKTALPGKGHSSPVVWADRIFLTTAVPHGDEVATRAPGPHGAHDNIAPSRRHRFLVLAYDRHTGRRLWQTEVRDARPHASTHETGSWASASAVTDGQHVIASFGSAGIYGLTIVGEVVWRRDLGDMHPKHGHGEGSSPALWGDTVVVNWDHEENSFAVALDKRTGEPLWKVARDENTSWSSPLIVEHDGKPQVIIAATHRVRAYDLASGKPIWECGGLGGNVVATPVAADGLVYVANSYDTRRMMAIRLASARGDVTGTDAVVWTRDRDTPYVPSPLLYGDALCFLKHYQGILTCVNAANGETLYGPERLPGIGNVYASPVGAAGRAYIVDLDGTTVVLALGERPKVLARNQLDDAFAASPAAVDGALYLRGERFLYAISRRPAER